LNSLQPVIGWIGLLAAILLGASAPAAAQTPHLDWRGEARQLIVDGKPFLILGGELGNSSASHAAYLKPHWAKLKAMRLNTVLAPASWELIEPEEGRFDWTSVDGLLADARANDMRLVLLWFGAWKNSMSTYVPGWVKRDRKRFPYALSADGKTQEILSAFGPATRDADTRAFAALMAHLRKVDGDRGTVIMVQVENEIGFLPDAREHGPEANAAFAERRPNASLKNPPRNLNLAPWSADAEEEFTAWHYARYTEAVAAAGKRAYPLPLFVNGAQGRPGRKPGEYPSGGPLAHLFELWKRGAPSIDFLAPDVYFPSFAGIVEGYARPGNLLFVPEANNAGDPRAVANAMRVIGRHQGIGFSPFSIETIDDAGAKRLGSMYAMLDDLAPTILEAQSKGRITGFGAPVSFDGKVDESFQTASFGGYRFTATFIDPWTPRDKQQPSEHGGLLIWLGGEDFLIAGSGITFTVEPEDGKGRAGLDWVDEGGFTGGEWTVTRRLNGDQTHQGRHLRLPPGGFGIQKLRLYRY
jgi:beta-galactosidase GanA